RAGSGPSMTAATVPTAPSASVSRGTGSRARREGRSPGSRGEVINRVLGRVLGLVRWCVCRGHRACRDPCGHRCRFGVAFRTRAVGRTQLAVTIWEFVIALGSIPSSSRDVTGLPRDPGRGRAAPGTSGARVGRAPPHRRPSRVGSGSRFRSGSGPGSARFRSGFGPVPVRVRPGFGSRFPSGFGVRGPGVVGRGARPGHAESMTGTTDGTGGTDGTSGTGAAGGAGAAPRRASAPRKDREQGGRETGREARGELRAALQWAVAGEVDFGTTARALTTMDASNYRRVPLGVVAPRDTDDVAAALEVCREHGVPVVARGGGTSIAG